MKSGENLPHLNTYVKRNLKENHSYLQYLQEKREKTLEQVLFLMLKRKKYR
jgi:hypothetical protein